jgi:hypothetical protein
MPPERMVAGALSPFRRDGLISIVRPQLIFPRGLFILLLCAVAFITSACTASSPQRSAELSYFLIVCWAPSSVPQTDSGTCKDLSIGESDENACAVADPAAVRLADHSPSDSLKKCMLDRGWQPVYGGVVDVIETRRAETCGSIFGPGQCPATRR